jgi:phage replication-related protein YjqB (UPF0714/DUF867 family)
VFDELLAHPGVEEDLQLRSRFGFMAFHGGSLEEMTDVIASAAAERAGASLYAVRQPADFQWHIPSKLIDPVHSTALQEFLDHVDVAIAVHGFGRQDMWATLLLGGGNRELATRLGAELRDRLPQYTVLDEIDQIPTPLRGLHPDNPINLPKGGGVQLELPPRVRGMGPYWKEWEGKGLTPHTEALIEGLAATAQSRSS